jgi:hypothetical protein
MATMTSPTNTSNSGREFVFQLKLGPATVRRKDQLVSLVTRLIANCGGSAGQVTESTSEPKPYVNVHANANDPSRFWREFKHALQFEDDLRKLLIVVAEGSERWDDYLLLHHYNAKQTIDNI